MQELPKAPEAPGLRKQKRRRESRNIEERDLWGTLVKKGSKKILEQLKAQMEPRKKQSKFAFSRVFDKQ